MEWNLWLPLSSRLLRVCLVGPSSHRLAELTSNFPGNSKPGISSPLLESTVCKLLIK